MAVIKTDKKKGQQRHGTTVILKHCWWNGKYHSNLENNLVIHQKGQAYTPFDPVITLLCVYSREIKTCLHKNLYMSVHGRIIHNSQGMEGIQCLSTDGWINKDVYSHGKMLFGKKKEMKFWHVFQHEWTLKALYQVKETNCKTLYWIPFKQIHRDRE